jgi:hypothetical protein
MPCQAVGKPRDACRREQSLNRSSRRSRTGRAELDQAVRQGTGASRTFLRLGVGTELEQKLAKGTKGESGVGAGGQTRQRRVADLSVRPREQSLNRSSRRSRRGRTELEQSVRQGRDALRLSARPLAGTELEQKLAKVTKGENGVGVGGQASRRRVGKSRRLQAALRTDDWSTGEAIPCPKSSTIKN